MHSLLRLLPYYRQYRGTLWRGLGLLLLARVFEAIVPQLLRRGIDGIAAGAAPLAFLATGIFACIAARYVSIWFGRRAVRALGVLTAYDLRNRFYGHLQRQGPAFFATHRTGDLMARAINDIGLIHRLVAAGTRTVVVLIFSSAVAFAFMLVQSPSLTLLLLPPMPIIFGVAYFASQRLYHESLALQEGFSDLSDRVQENLGGIRTIQALHQEERETEHFNASNQRYLDRGLALLRTNSLLASAMPGLGALAILIVLYFGGLRVLAGDITLGTFTAFLWYLNMVLWPVREAGNMINLFQRGAAGCKRLFELLDAEPEIADRPGLASPGPIRGAIELRDVSYAHPGSGVPALDDVSLEVSAGETLAVLGRIGSGKTTLLNLLVRLVDVAPGAVRIDGTPIRDFPLNELRRGVALVPQEAFLFSASVRENLSYDEPERAQAALQGAAHDADFAETIAGLPDGWATEVGERGVLLSGGQKQRLTLARALVRDAPILLLDDPYASVDAETEERILRRLAPLRRGKTTVVVTHRVSAARTADRVLVLEGGRAVERGTPAELRAAGGAYARMERAQRRTGYLLARLGREGECEHEGGAA
jgi:ATP-binding cassette subfamily B protein